MTKKLDKDVKIAKISALQAIIVALITAVAGAATGYFVIFKKDVKTQTMHWIKIENIEAGYLERQNGIRVVMTVNGINYSYPSKAIFAEIGPDMSKERFPIPPADKYFVSFMAFVGPPDPENRLDEMKKYEFDLKVERQLSQEVEEVLPAQIPTGTRTYKLYPIGNTLYRDAGPGIKILYTIE